MYGRTIQGCSPTCPLLVLGQISSKDPHPLGVPPDSFYKAHCVHSSVGGLKGEEKQQWRMRQVETMSAFTMSPDHGKVLGTTWLA